MDFILASSLTPWVATPTVVQVAPLSAILRTAARPAALYTGSPSLMTMQCLTDRSCFGSVRVSAAAVRNGSKSGMSPGIMPSTFASSRLRSSPTSWNGITQLTPLPPPKPYWATPTMSAGPSRWMASLAISFCHLLPSAISLACMTSTSPPLPAAFSALISQSTGRAASTGVFW